MAEKEEKRTSAFHLAIFKMMQFSLKTFHLSLITDAHILSVHFQAIRFFSSLAQTTPNLALLSGVWGLT